MSEELKLDVGQEKYLKLALRREGWKAHEVEELKKEGVLGRFLEVLRGDAKIVPIPVLAPVSTVQVETVERFVASGAFAENNPAGIKFYLWPNFKDYFLNKVEENIPATKLAVQRLECNAKNDRILAELGNNPETALAYVYELISRQPNGEEGVLLVNGMANIFYVRDAKDKLCAVYARWYSAFRQWYLGAGDFPDPWFAVYQVISQVSSS